MSERKFIAYWDSLGFEVLCDITTYERQRLLADIKGSTDKPKPPFNLNAMLLRARYNPQRDPEIWIFTASEGINEEYLQQAATDNPQTMADLIRTHGERLFPTVKKAKRVIE